MKSKLPILMLFKLLLIPTISASLTSGEATIMFGTIFSVLISAIFFLILSIITANKTIKIFFISLSGITLVVSVGMGVSIIQQFFSGFSTLSQSYGAFYILLTILLGGAVIALIIWLVIVAFKSFNSYRGLIEPEVPEKAI